MEALRLRIFHLHHATNVDAILLSKMYQIDPTLKAPYFMSASDLAQTFLISLKRATKISTFLQQQSIEQLTEEYARREIQWITRLDADFPPLLQTIYDPPWILFYCGNIHLIANQNPLAVIGARKPSSEAEPLMKAIISPLIKKGLIIVSGLAEGVDGMAHKLAIHHQGDTVGILGSGFDHIYPRSHTSLAKYMMKKQLIISEYPPAIRPQKWHFPQRNRLISGLSKAVLIVEAREKSGSMNTANFALEQGREVFAIPGSPLKKEARGCLRLIQEGAKPIITADDILEEY
ncbi:DNA-processing protein DprA [Alteribacter populi]|uniref:DNA-processing protein DprA n=1 Tax=Alteribacter populi TaxID=2011011 RepID=UPI000BBB4ED0|nr:DNA-processing protein DprA [Alteribacter populi]